MATSDSDFNSSSKPVISSEAPYILSSSRKLVFFMNKDKSFMNKLNNIGANIEPRGTLETNIFNRLSMIFILTLYFLYFKLEYIKTKVSTENL